MIYLAIPMATIGGIFALWLRDMPFSISAGVGFIVLFGVAVLNGLVMVSGLNELKEEGVTNLKDRIIQGTKRRIRPIMLTAFTAVLGLLPMVLGLTINFIDHEITYDAPSSQWWRQLSTSIAGGLSFATILTLFFTPCLLMIGKRFDRYKHPNDSL